MKKQISAIIFWGALWGLEEATLGHLLHITALNIGWFFWFPLAYFFMDMVYKQTGKLNSILFTSMVAAVIKLVNLFMTGNPVIVICPAISILLEGISLFAVLKLFDWKKQLQKYRLIEIVSVSLLWRILFLVALFAIPVWIMPAYPFKDALALLKFLLYEGLINSLFIYAAFKLFSGKLIKTRTIEISFKPLAATGLLAVTLIIQWVVTL